MISETLSSYNSTATSNLSSEQVSDKLTSEDFLNMYLKELSLQDPLDPMDSQKMLEQTMQMTTIEQSTTQMEKSDEMISILNKNYMQQFTGLIGREVNTQNTTLDLEESGQSKVFNYYNERPISKGTAYISDANGDTVGTIALNNLSAGGNALEWNGNMLDGSPAPAGQYEIFFSAVDNNDLPIDIIPGRFKVESVLIQDGETILNIGNDKYINLEEIYEFL